MSDDDDELEALLAPADIWGESVKNVVKTIENRRRWRRLRAQSGGADGGESVSAPLMRNFAARGGRAGAAARASAEPRANSTGRLAMV